MPAGARATYPGTNGEILYIGGGGLSTLEPSTGRSDLVASGVLGYGDVAADGETVAYSRAVPQSTSGGPASDLFLASIGDGGERLVARRELSAVSQLALAPDAASIAFIGDRSGSGIISIGSDGSRLRQITSTVNDQDFEFSPDGSKIVFTRMESPGPCGPDEPNATSIWIAEADGSGISPLVDPAKHSAMEPAFTPDGRRVVYVRSRGRFRCDDDQVRQLAVHSVRLTGRGDRSLTKPSLRTRRNPIPSPDGRQLLLMADHGLKVMSLRGRGKARPVRGGRLVGTPLAWAPAPR